MRKVIQINQTNSEAEVCLAALGPGKTHILTYIGISDSETQTASTWKLEGSEIKDTYALSPNHAGADVRISDDGDMVELVSGALEGREFHVGGFVEIEEE